MQINNLPKPTANLKELDELQKQIVIMIRTIGEYDLHTDPKLIEELPASLEHVYTRLFEFIEFTRKIKNPDFLGTFETIIINLRILHHEIVGVIAFFMDIPVKIQLKDNELKSILENVSTDDLATKVTIIEERCAWLIEKYRP
jgi:hypothetical protein